MNDDADLIARLRALGSERVTPHVSARHLAAVEAATGPGADRRRSHRLRIVAAFAVGLFAGTSGLATAGALPDSAQEVAHRTLGAVGINVPHGDRYWGEGCTGEATQNHGQYVRSQPKGKRAEAAASRCGKPIQAGTDGQGSQDPAGECHGPPPWAGKGKPDAEAKAAWKQKCGKGEGDSDEQKAPADGVQPAVPAPETTTSTGPSPQSSETTGPTVTTATTATTTTTAPASTTTTSLPETTTSTTSGPGAGGTTTPSTPVEPPAAGQSS